MQKTITVGEKTYLVRELLAVEVDDIDFNDKKSAIKKQIMLSTNLTSEDYDKLTLKERIHIMHAINELNGIEDFRSLA